jgi:hypothetical protein
LLDASSDTRVAVQGSRGVSRDRVRESREKRVEEVEFAVVTSRVVPARNIGGCTRLRRCNRGCYNILRSVDGSEDGGLFCLASNDRASASGECPGSRTARLKGVGTAWRRTLPKTCPECCADRNG